MSDDHAKSYELEWVQEQVWDLQRELNTLREDFDLLKKQFDRLNDMMTGDGK